MQHYVGLDLSVIIKCPKYNGQQWSSARKIRNSHRQTHLSLAVVLFMLVMAMASGELFAQSVGLTTDTRPIVIRRMVTQGLAKTVNENLFKCAVALRNYRISAVGTITADDGTVLTVPAQTAYQTGPKLPDLFNECNKTTPAKLTDLKADTVPIVEIDRDGEVITGYIVADNYFELYVNGRLIGVDPVPFTPFNSVIVRFKAKRPYTYALKAVDWEERLGLGMETNRGTGGLIARFSDGTVTDSTWKAQSFYIAPLAQPDDVVENGNIHDTSKLGRVYPSEKCLPVTNDVLQSIIRCRRIGQHQASTTPVGRAPTSSPTTT